MSSMVLANVSSPRPVFMITGLNPGRDLRLLVFATNKNGRSDPTVLEGFTTKVAQLQVGMLENIFRPLNIFWTSVPRMYSIGIFANLHIHVTFSLKKNFNILYSKIISQFKSLIFLRT